MAGSMLSVAVSNAPDKARLAIARPDDDATRAIIVAELSGRPSASLQTPGDAGSYELRLTQDRDGAPVILLRQPLVTTPASATLSGPARVARGNGLPVRGIGPNGEQDRVVIVPKDAAADAAGPSFFPAENSEATLEAPETPGAYELRYVMHAPLAEHRILARQEITVE
jgi:Ca-activated chloride channel family protein